MWYKRTLLSAEWAAYYPRAVSCLPTGEVSYVSRVLSGDKDGTSLTCPLLSHSRTDQSCLFHRSFVSYKPGRHPSLFSILQIPQMEFSILQMPRAELRSRRPGSTKPSGGTQRQPAWGVRTPPAGGNSLAPEDFWSVVPGTHWAAVHSLSGATHSKKRGRATVSPLTWAPWKSVYR